MIIWQLPKDYTYAGLYEYREKVNFKFYINPFREGADFAIWQCVNDEMLFCWRVKVKVL